MLTGELRARIESHVAECERCRIEDAADRELSAVLESRLPRRRAPEALRRSIEERLAGEKPRAAARVRKVPRALMTAVAVTFAAAAALFFFVGHDRSSADPLYAEAVNDHLRVLYADRPIEIESGGVHQVKPWFSGRLDFAPIIGFGGDDDFPLEGGAVAYFLDRKAAAFEFKRRLHPITLFVFRGDGLPWPAVPPASSVPLGHVRAAERTMRGFHVLLWRDGDLGYALVSDLDPDELATLASKIAGS